MDKKSGEELASTLDANPSEPIQPAAPVAEPVTEPAPAAQAAPVAAAPAPKKKKTGLIVGVTIGALAVAGGGTAAAILLLNNKSAGPADATSAIADTVSDVLTGNIKTFAFDGTAKLGFAAQGASGSINFTFGGEGADQNGKANLNVDASVMGMDISASVNTVLKNNKAYFKFEGIKDTLEKTGLSMMLGTKVTKSIDALDGTWYMLPVTTASMAPSISLGANCSLDFEKLIEDRDALSKLYKENSFIKAEKYTGNDVAKKKSDLYSLTLDKTAFVNFANALQENYTTGQCGKPATEDQIGDIDLSGVKLLAEFDNNSISRIYASADKDGNSLVADINLSTPSNVNVEAPSDAKSAEELSETITPLIQTFFGGSMGGFGGGSFGGGQFDDDDDDLTDNCIEGDSFSTNCLDVDDDNDDDNSDTFDYDSLKDLLDSYDTSDYDISELDDIMKQLDDYKDLFKNLDYDDLRSLEDLDVDSIDSSDLNSALEMLKSLQ